jgi:DNA repair protein RecN (Recombination protein N)
MLVSLHIENIAVIKKIDIDFNEGFTVLTGETGAGKSIIIDSINILLGARPSREIVRSGEETAVVSGLFCNISPANILSLSELGITPDEDGSIFIQRSISSDGRTSNKINGRTVSVSLHREVGSLLINIHGQHDNQKLLDVSKHIYYLDRYADNESLLEHYIKKYDNMESIKRQLSELYRDEDEKERAADMLRYQINDIDSANLKQSEENDLEAQKKRVQNIDKINKQAKTVYSSLYEGDKGLSACQQIDLAINALKQIADIFDGFEEILDKLENYRYEIEDIAFRANDLLDDDISDPLIILDKIESRLDTISKLKRKYGATTTDILNFREKAAVELEDIEMADEKIHDLNASLKETEGEATEYADRLSECRRTAASSLSDKITAELAFLEMSKVCFSVNVCRVPLSRIGGDEVEFMISANPGEPLKPLGKIASGGELSRVMLAIKSVLADREHTQTLIFDEIDTGISGKISHKIGIKLKQISGLSQVICVTHSAQIATLAHNHLYISKSEHNGRVETTVTSLDYDERVKEIARIIGGLEITESLLETVTEMLNMSENF